MTKASVITVDPRLPKSDHARYETLLRGPAQIKIVAAVERGMPKTEAAKTFGVSLSSVKRYWRLAAHEEPLAPRKGGGRAPKANAAVVRLLEEDVAARPYAAAHERAAFLRGASGVGLSASTAPERGLFASKLMSVGVFARVPSLENSGRSFKEGGKQSFGPSLLYIVSSPPCI